MGRRYRGKNNSIISIVGDVVHIASRLSWWGALLTGLIAYILVSMVLGGYLESQLAAYEGSRFYPVIEARYERFIRVCDWVGIACMIAGVIFAIRNYCFDPRAGIAEKKLVTILSKIFGRGLD